MCVRVGLLREIREFHEYIGEVSLSGNGVISFNFLKINLLLSIWTGERGRKYVMSALQAHPASLSMTSSIKLFSRHILEW